MIVVVWFFDQQAHLLRNVSSPGTDPRRAHSSTFFEPAEVPLSAEEILQAGSIKPLSPDLIQVPKPVVSDLLGFERPLIIGHRQPNPDLDTVGSTLALYRLLRAAGKEPTACIDAPLLSVGWLDTDDVIAGSKDLRPVGYDGVILVDVSSRAQIGPVFDSFEELPVVIIDHHYLKGDSPDPSSSFVVPEADATALLVLAISEDPAVSEFTRRTEGLYEPLLAGLMADTSFFEKPVVSRGAQAVFKWILQEKLSYRDYEQIRTAMAPALLPGQLDDYVDAMENQELRDGTVLFSIDAGAVEARFSTPVHLFSIEYGGVC